MNFTRIKPEDYQRLKPYFDNQPYKLCVYSLASLLVWSTQEYYPCALERDDSLIIHIEFETKKHHRSMLLPISSHRQWNPAQLHALADELGFEQYYFVSDEYIERFDLKNICQYFEVCEQTDFEDYVYLKDDMALLKGNKYSKKRNLINQFNRSYADNGRVAVNPIRPQDFDECVEFLEKWCEENDCDKDANDDLFCEKLAAINNLRFLDLLETKGILVRIDGRVCGFGIGSKVTDEVGALHFEKALSGIKGLYQFLDQQCALQLFNGYRYINKESDMGIPGIAKSKKSYYPTMRVKSYCLKLK